MDIELRANTHLEMDFIDLILDGVSSDKSSAVGWREDASDHG